MKQVREVLARSRQSPLGIANAWIMSEDKLMEVYVRVQHKSYGGLAYTCFTVANIKVSPGSQGQGVFTAWLTLLEAELKGTEVKMVMVESIMELRFFMFLKRMGYTELMTSTEQDLFKFL